MKNFNIRYILPDDDKDLIIKKSNQNFNEVLFNGIGGKGDFGPIGATGIVGQIGKDGNTGLSGDRAAKWNFTYIEPLIADSQESDIWVNTGPTGFQNVYKLQSGSWILTGSILSTNVFSLMEGISGPANSESDNAIYIRGGSPSDYTVILSDAVGTTGDLNPNLSKLMLSTKAGLNTIQTPIIGFSKTFQQSSSIPGFYWKSFANTDLGIELFSPGMIDLSSGSILSIGSTGGTVDISSGSNMNIESKYTAGLTSANQMSLTSPASINISSSNINAGNTLFDINVNSGQSIISVGYTGGNACNVSSGGNGIFAVTTSESADISIFGTTGPSGSSVWNTRGDGACIIGPTGEGNGLIVSKLHSASYQLGPTFYIGAVRNSYVSVTPYADSVVITPTISSGGPITIVSANGNSNRVYLSFDSNYSWIQLTGENERTLDFYLDSTVYGFGGIRMKQNYPYPDSTKEITDQSLGLTGACRHIRLTFFNENRQAFYQAFLSNASSTDKCGWISYDSSLQASGEITNDPISFQF